MVIYLDRPSPEAAYPEADGPPYASCLALLRVGFACALPVTIEAVVSYTAFPPLHVSMRFISVALSLKSPSPDVIRHPAL